MVEIKCWRDGVWWVLFVAFGRLGGLREREKRASFRRPPLLVRISSFFSWIAGFFGDRRVREHILVETGL